MSLEKKNIYRGGPGLEQHHAFINWIDTVGVYKVARLLEVDPATVRYWRRRQTFPRVDQMRKIKRVTKGVIGYSQIIDGTTTDRGSR